jgi:hypothetical protein
MFQTEVVEKIKIHVLPAVYEIMWKNVVESDMPQRTTQYGACALHAG